MSSNGVGTTNLLQAPSPHITSLTALSALSLLVFAFIIHPLLLAPISHLPGPRLAALSHHYISYFDARLRRNRTILSWHRRYSPVVRIRPNEVAIADPADFRAVYAGKSRYDKGAYFRKFTHRGRDCLFSTTDYGRHQSMRRRIAGAYTKTRVLGDAAGYVRERVGRVMGVVDGAAEKGERVDFFMLWACFSLDVVTRFAYGEANGTRSIEDDENEKSREMIRRKQRAQLWAPVWTNFPWVHGSRAAKRILGRDYVESLDTARMVERFADVMIERQEVDEEWDQHPSIYRALRDSQVTAGESDRDAAASELFDVSIAGQDTTASALTSLTWRLGRHEEWQGRLRDDLSGLEKAEDDLPSYADLEGCGVLDAVIRETLRMHPVSSGRTERVVPIGGRTFSGVFVPEGTVVVGQLLALHRNEAVFPDPDSWKPERWLNITKEEFTETEKSYVPFGYGGRICIGRHLAMLEIKMAISMLVRRYEISLTPSCTDASMETLDTLAAVPKGLRCELQVKRVPDNS